MDLAEQVRLSQETLEVLSLVAYRQPISRRAIEDIAKRGAGSHLRQLLQRELVVLDRGDGASDAQVTYRRRPVFCSCSACVGSKSFLRSRTSTSNRTLRGRCAR